MPPINPLLRDEKQTTLMSAKGADGWGGYTMDVRDYTSVTLHIIGDGAGADGDIKIGGSDSDAAPTWASGPSLSNEFDYIGLNNLTDGTVTDGDTGEQFETSADVRVRELNVEHLSWISAELDNWTAGAFTVKARGVKR